jgi:transcription antitermination factor NusG
MRKEGGEIDRKSKNKYIRNHWPIYITVSMIRGMYSIKLVKKLFYIIFLLDNQLIKIFINYF